MVPSRANWVAGAPDQSRRRHFLLLLLWMGECLCAQQLGLRLGVLFVDGLLPTTESAIGGGCAWLGFLARLSL